MRAHLSHFVRFFTGSLAGAILDFVVASILILMNISMLIACCIGFLTAVILTYIIHLRWTFSLSSNELIFSVRMLKFLISSAFTLLIRIGFIYTVQYFFIVNNSFIALIIVLLAIAMSFCLNYLIAKYIVFKSVKY